MNITNVTICKVTNAPLCNVQNNWPLIVEALLNLNITSDCSLAAAAATVAVDSNFIPVHEHGGPEQWVMYDSVRCLGNTHPGDGIKYHGRGFIQLTGRYNYMKYGELLNIDLLNNPDLALESQIAANIFALFFVNNYCNNWAERGDWRQVRKAIRKDLAGWSKFKQYIDRFIPHVV